LNASPLRRWVWRGGEPDPVSLKALCGALDISPLAARALILRGVSTVPDGTLYLQSRLLSLPDPFLLPDMERAALRLADAVQTGETIVIHGDYDVDGITGTALLVETLRALGASVGYHIPLRLKDGYGLSAVALRQSAQEGARVIVSVDCGISAVDEARLAADLGLDLIITDHHQPPETLPVALAVVAPSRSDSLFPFRSLAGVGVAFFLLVGLRKVLRERGFFAQRPEPDLRRGLDLVALGTIADIVPLQGVNRILTRFGLILLSQSARPGVRALRDVAAVKEVTCGAVGFRLAPRLNAAGRLEDASLGVELLLESSHERAREIAGMLDGFNRERQKIEEVTLQQAVERLEQGEGREHSIVLADERWHPGVIGIVASRLVERCHRPVVLIALENGKGKGSARSIRGFHLYHALHACRDKLEGFGGHEFAAGVSICAEGVEVFAEALEEVARNLLTPEDLIPTVSHDGEVLLEEITAEALSDFDALAPFGAGNPEPSFVALGLQVAKMQTVGEKHLRFVARQGGYSFPCIAFGMAPRQEELCGEVDLLFTPGLNEYKGRTEIQLRIRDWRPSVR
jgi:single-stranded-DNA-specific exonuclease